MTLSGEYAPSSQEFVREQVALYERTGGVDGNTMGGKPVVIVTSIGARSGKLRKTPLMRVEHDGCYALIASKGGAPEHPEWYANLQANPTVDIQDGPEPKSYTIRELDGDERETWWERSVAAWPDYASYQQQTERRIPVLLAEPA